jgi:hypothetical protein
MLEAREDLRMLKVVNYSHLKKESRTKFYSALNKKAYQDEPKRALTMGDLAKVLRG